MFERARRLPLPTWWAALGAVLVLVVRWRTQLVHWSFNDLHVYQRAGIAILHGDTIYNTRHHLQFTYPAFAAGAFVPLALLGFIVGAITISLVSLVAYLAVIKQSGAALHLSPGRIAVLAGICLAYEPVLRTLRLGQINLLLLALVVFDALVVRPPARGLLTGIAAGIKVVPAVFVLYFVVSGDRRSAIRCVASFAATIGISACFAPADTWRFWTKLVLSSDRVGRTMYMDNQSISGVVARMLDTNSPPRAITAPLALAAVVLAVVAARRQHANGRALAALTCIAVGGLLASPISWTHHWVWLVPITLVLVADRRWYWAGAFAIVSIVAPPWLTPSGDLFHNPHLHDSVVQQIAAAALPIIGVAYLLLMTRQPVEWALPTPSGQKYVPTRAQKRPLKEWVEQVLVR